jgi:tRNA-Thr(GGU) m(6)t(6)A37 methyltransferase TsaA
MYSIEPVGIIHSELKSREEAPMQGDEGAPKARLEIFSAYAPGLDGIQRGDEVMIITWLHLANRDVLQVHPRGDLNAPLRGVFSTRSPDRPNPVGLHRVRILEVLKQDLWVEPLEAIDGTPVVDIKPI